jgi:hypothetical protein
VLGVVVGTALMQTLYNSIVLLKIPDELEFTIIGAVILFGVAADELTRMLAARFRSKDSSFSDSNNRSDSLDTVGGSQVDTVRQLGN